MPNVIWEVSWILKGPNNNNFTYITKKYGLGEGKDIVIKYRGEFMERNGLTTVDGVPVKPVYRWFLEYAFTVFNEEHKPRGYILDHVEIRDTRDHIRWNNGHA
jgi:hypothetical protein